MNPRLPNNTINSDCFTPRSASGKAAGYGERYTQFQEKECVCH